MKKSDHGLQLSRVECCNAGFELSLQVVLHDPHVSYPDREHVLVQGVYQGKELIKVLVLESGRVQKRGEMVFACKIQTHKYNKEYTELAFVSHNQSNDKCKCVLSLDLTDEISSV